VVNRFVELGDRVYALGRDRDRHRRLDGEAGRGAVHECPRRLQARHDEAEAVVFLASPAASAITGQALVIDGGGIQA
jgi:NAD(P)-dependent dehydrogenase (short-subunit alcohol dehydrogenase family)